MKAKFIFLFTLTILPLLSIAQTSDDFSDGEIISNPAWTGDVASFEILDPPTSGDGSINADAGNDAFVLRSLESGDACITTASTVVYGEWIFSVADGRNWSVSSTNDYKIILMADDNTPANLYDGASMDFNGYYIQFDGGMDDQFILYKQTGTTEEVIIDTDYPTTTDGATPLGRTIKVTRSAAGDWSIFIDEGFETTPTTQIGGTVNDNTHTTSTYFGIVTNVSNPDPSRVVLFDNLQITPLPTNDQTSVVSAGADAEPLTISSLTNSADGLQVFDINLADLASGDMLPTVIDNISFTQGDNNQIADWTNAIAGAKLFGNDLSTGFEGTVNAENITFTANDFISINDGENETYQLYLWLKTDLSNISDNDIIELKLDYTNITCDASGSSFGSGTVESGDNNIAIDIQATTANFVNYPPMVGLNLPFSLSLSATDENGNIDADASPQATLTLTSGSGNLTSASGITQNLTNGVYSWSDLEYDQLGNFSIQAEVGAFSAITTATIECVENVYHLDDDFEDGDLADWQENNPLRWEASTEEPINGTFSLKHIYDNDIAETDIIAHPLTGVDLSSEMKVWRFQLKFTNSSPSGSNNWNIFLMADNDQTEMLAGGNINGYVLGLNFGSETNDLVTLWSVSVGTPTEILATTFDWNNTDASTAKGFEISRTPDGEWEIKIDDNEGGFDNLVSYGTTTNTDHSVVNYFGVAYEYSSTLDRKLWLDDIYFGPFIPDTDPPQIDTVIALSPTVLEVYFSEEIDQTTAENTANYTVDNGVGTPQTATKSFENSQLVTLTFTTQFQEETDYLLNVQNVQDLNGNTIEQQDFPFTWENIALQTVTIVSSYQLDLYFNRNVEQISGETLANYSLSTIGNPISATFETTDSSLIHLEFNTDLQVNQEYTLTITNLQDNLGNQIETTDYTFIYYKVQQFDIVVNELMVDVSPAPVALPTEKYIELLNTSSHEIDFTGWTIQIGTNSPKDFPQATISAGGYAILCDEDAGGFFEPYGDVLPFLSTSQLTSTTGKSIVIRNNEGQVIENITYSPNWYGDEDKDNGGWSLERIDPQNGCFQDNNWHASLNYIGGTPGMQNSVLASNPDNEVPTIENLEFISSKHLKIDFSENIDTASGLASINYILNESVTPLFVEINQDDPSLVSMEFIDNFNFGSNTLSIKNISDNCSNVMNDTTINFVYKLINPVAVEPKSENQIKVYFSETIDIFSAENPNNFSVNNSIGTPQIAFRDLNDSSVVHLQFENSFTEDQLNTLSVSGIYDINGNISEAKDLNFTYHQPQIFDVVFNEIMVDINPAPLGLPEYQYVELYNTTDFELWLSDCNFVAEGQSERTFPTVSIAPKGFLILSKDDEDLADFGKNVNILGSSDLSQSGKELLLQDAAGNLISYVNYTDQWYDDENKADGGWSLEKIDPENFCGTKTNWTASTDISGGTPGTKNSVFAENLDETLPEVVQVSVISSNHLLVQFSKNVAFSASLDTANYEVANGIGNPISVSLSDTSYATVHLYFENQFTDAQANTLTISNIYDDCQNQMEQTAVDFTYFLINPKYVWVLNENQLQLKFSETVLLSSLMELSNFEVNIGIGSPSQAIRDAEDPSLIYLQFENEFENAQTYKISISGVQDVNQNTMLDAEMEFTYYTAQPNDLVINELLFNPVPNGADFVELYNRSIFPINISDMRIAKRDAETDEIINVYTISEQNYMLNAGEYLVLSVDTAVIQADFETAGKFLQLSSMPSYPDDEGVVVILNAKDSIIDEFRYSDDMHYALLSNEEGVSLERIDYDQPTTDEGNWHSAAQNVGFATPGYQNSQYKNIGDVEMQDEITLNPQVFSPDNDGYDDLMTINYEFAESGYVANVVVYDVKGRLIKTLAQNELLPIAGYWTWDGLNETNEKARIGIYAVIVEVFDLSGNVKTYKLACVVSGKK